MTLTPNDSQLEGNFNLEIMGDIPLGGMGDERWFITGQVGAMRVGDRLLGPLGSVIDTRRAQLLVAPKGRGPGDSQNLLLIT